MTIPKMHDGNSAAESYQARNVTSETADSTPMQIITDYTKLEEMLADTTDHYWLAELAFCFGSRLEKAIQGDAMAVRHILGVLSYIEKEALNRAEDWDENL